MKCNIKNMLDKYKLNYIIDVPKVEDHTKYKIKFDDNSVIIITVKNGADEFIYSIFAGQKRDYFMTNSLKLENIENFIENIESYKQITYEV